MNSFTEENYLKAIFKLYQHKQQPVSTNALAELLETKASSVTDMLKRLSDKGLVNHIKYQGATLTPTGKEIAVRTIRKHRLWEVFLVNHLRFKWDEVHEVAEQLEHIHSAKLIDRLDDFLGNPKYDPHGDPIPDKDGNIEPHKDISLSDLQVNEAGIIMGVKEHAPSFLQFLEKNQLLLGTQVQVINYFEFDQSLVINVNGQEKTVSSQVCKNLYVRKVEA